MKILVLLSTMAVAAVTAKPSEYNVPESYTYQGPPAPLAHDGTVVDTPEVARAKAAHLAAHAAAAARASHGHFYQPSPNHYTAYEDSGTRETSAHVAPYVHHAYNNYQGPPAPLAHDGRVLDTPEVAHAKAAHLAAHAHAAAKASHRYTGDYDGSIAHASYASPIQVNYAHHASPVGYHGPPAPLGEDGRVIDTPEVARAKEAHLQAYARAAALAALPDHRATSEEAPEEQGHYY